MQNNILRKYFVYAIILLLIGLCISSSAYGDNSMKSFKESSSNFSLKNDYVLAYWKLDTGSGNTAYDSSGHDFDGTIYGASWVTGKHGKALDFDGIDDYISVDDYAENLGLNKTDDMIFSFWLKSDDEGIILSMSTSWGSNPDFFITLCSNGSLEFKVWTNYCGIEFYSKGTYNDNKWYHVVYYFNGITSNPTVELYVNGSFDNNKTEWLCPIQSDEFTKAKIGRRASDSSEYFDGILDEIKIIKYPGGNKQEKPDIDGPLSGEVGEELTYTFVSDDPEEDNVSYYIDWGDGNKEGWLGPYLSGQEIDESHSWDKEGEYEIKAKVRDYWDDSFWNTYVIRIGNDAPYPPQKPNGPITGEIGIEYTFSSSTIDPDGDELEYKWDWGDGNTSLWLGPYASGTICKANYTWIRGGDYNITVKARDKYGESDWSNPLQIHIVEPVLHIEKITG